MEFVKNILKKITPSKLIDTSITLRTKYLNRELKSFFNLNVKLSFLALLSALLTAITSLTPLEEHIKDESIKLFELSFSEWLPYILAALTIILSISALISTFKTANPVRFINKMIADQYDVEEFTAIFIIKMVFDNVPKILVFRSETWNSYFLPYCHYDKKSSHSKDFNHNLKIPLAEILEISENDFEIYNDFTQSDYVTIKRNPSHEGKSKINYKFYYVKFNNQYVGQKFISSHNSYFSWKSKYELAKDIDTQLNNGDVLGIIDELSLLNQSKIAFKEQAHGMFDVPSRYRIIWNLTTECYFKCPICATNSGNDIRCTISEKEKMQILINLSSINGYIDHLDISGGDPLKNEEDRSIIRMANQLFPYTPISVTTTGKALENLSVDELIQTVKTCDITYDIPYNICTDELKQYREYQYNYSNFKQLERFSNSGIKIGLNIHIPILPVNIDKETVSTILEDLSKINPAQIKFIRLMPVGRMGDLPFPDNYDPDKFLQYVKEIMTEKNYKFKIEYNCSLGVKVFEDRKSNETCRNCEMLTNKLGIDAQGNVYTCIWGAYIPELVGKPLEENPFYLGDLKKESLYDILTNPQTIKMTKKLKEKNSGCRVCGYIANSTNDSDPVKRMLYSKDPLLEIYSSLNTNSQ